MHTFTPHPAFQPVTERIQPETDPEKPRYDNGLDFNLIQLERSKAALYTCELEDKRRRANEEDAAAARKAPCADK